MSQHVPDDSGRAAFSADMAAHGVSLGAAPQGWARALDELALEAGPGRVVVLVDDGRTALVCDRRAFNEGRGA